MKKLLLSCGILLSMAAGALGADKPTNEAFYLVGSFNNSAPTVSTASSYKYKVTDEDGDGVYTGSFKIPKKGSWEFQFLSEPLAAKDEWVPENLWSTNQWMCLFSSEPFVKPMYRATGYDTIMNWDGGTMDITIKWIQTPDGEWQPELTIVSPDQPKRPAAPQVYIIGDFNDWKAPTATSDNGAKKFDQTFEIPTYTQTYLSLPLEACDKFKFAVCKINEDGKIQYFSPDIRCPFTLYQLDGVQNRPYFSPNGKWVDEYVENDCIFKLFDWKGGILEGDAVLYLSDNSIALTFGGKDTPPMATPEHLYALIEVDGKKEIHEIEFNEYNGFNSYWTTWNPETNSEENSASIIFTTENSLNPAPENCYGVPENTIPQDIINYRHPDYTFQLIKGGEPFAYKFPNHGYMTVDLRFDTSTARMFVAFPGSIASEKLYVCGNVMTAPDGIADNFYGPYASNQEHYDNFALENCGDYFQKTFYIPVKESDMSFPDNLPQFRFFTELLGWTRTASLGSAPDDFYCLPVDLSNGPVTLNIVPEGLGNWGMCNSSRTWEGNWVTMTVFCETGKLQLEIAKSGIDDIALDEEASGESTESWFNLQGIKVDRPDHGLYIHIVNGTSRLELIK